MDKCVEVVLLGHKSLAGKDTVAGFMKPYGYVRKAFADKLKSVVSDLYNFNHDQMYGIGKDIEDLRYENTIDDPISNSYKPCFTPRRILQRFGQDQRRIDPDIWARYIFNAIDIEVSNTTHDLFKEHYLYVITDFRFKNEYDVAKLWSKKDSGVHKTLYVVKIDRPAT